MLTDGILLPKDVYPRIKEAGCIIAEHHDAKTQRAKEIGIVRRRVNYLKSTYVFFLGYSNFSGFFYIFKFYVFLKAIVQISLIY